MLEPIPSENRTCRESQRFTHAGLTLLAVFLVCSRFVALTADPPHDMTLNYVSDEGWWAHNARLHAVFGQWIMDEHNTALFWAPLYTGALRLIYGVAGWGLWQTRVLAAGSGLLTCLAVYVYVRAHYASRTALFATALLGTNFLWTSYNRVGFVESFQSVMITATMLCVAAAARRTAWASAAGIMLALAVLAKISAITFGVAIGTFWIWELLWPRDTRLGSSARRSTLKQICLFGGSFAAAGFVVWLFLIQPNWSILAADWKHVVNMKGHQSPFMGLFTLGLNRHDATIWTSMFVVHAPFLLTGAALLAAQGIADNRKSLDATQRLCWCWLVLGLFMIGLRAHFDSERRYLSLLPPLAILLGIEWSRSGLSLVSRHDINSRAINGRSVLIVGLLAGVFAAMLRGALANHLHVAAHAGRLPGLANLGQAGAAGIAWLLVALPAFGVFWIGARWLPNRRLLVSGSILLTAIVTVNVAKTSWYFSHLTFALPTAAKQLEAIGHQLPRDSRVVVGDSADTLGLDTDFFTFIIRRWEHNKTFMNVDGWKRFHPSIVIDGDAPEGFTHIADLHLALDRHGKPRKTSPVYVRSSLQRLEQESDGVQ